MSRQTTKLEVAKRFECELKRLLPQFEDRIYLVLDDSLPAHAIADQELITWMLEPAPFEYATQAGGGHNSIRYQGTAVVRIWRSDYTDEAGTSREMCMGERNGLFQLEGQLLQLVDSTLDDDPFDASKTECDPILTNGIKALSDGLEKPQSYEGLQEGFIAALTVQFSLDFHWRLTEECPDA